MGSTVLLVPSPARAGQGNTDRPVSEGRLTEARLGPAITLEELEELTPVASAASNPPMAASPEPQPPLPPATPLAPATVELPALPPAESGAATPQASPAEQPLPRLAEPGPQPPMPLELELTSNQQEYDAQLERYISTGNVTANLAGGRLQADRIEFDPATRALFASGSVRFQRGQQFFQASRLRYSLLEGIGEMEDVYGVLDLDGSAQDLNLETPPSAPLPAPEPLACTPAIPPIPEWQPYPWAVTGWGGQMYTANFGGTFTFNGEYRPEYLLGGGVMRRLVDAGPLSLELDANLLGHHAARQPGGPYNQAVPYADSPAQTFAEGTLGIGVRLWVRPWLNVFFEEGVSLLSEYSNWEKTERENYATFLNYLAFEVEGLVTPEWSIVGRIHHRSGAYGTYSGVREGSNAYLIGVRHRFGEAPRRRKPPEVAPPQGCPGAPPPDSRPQEDLASQLEAVTMGAERSPAVSTFHTPAVTPGKTSPRGGSVWSRAREAERVRNAAIAAIDQRVQDVQYQQSLTAERRRNFGFGASGNTGSTDNATQLASEEQNAYGGARPPQLTPIQSQSNRRSVQGTISRWRIQANRLTLTPTTFSGERVGFSNDPFTPAQSWMDSENVVATLQPNGDTVIKAGRNAVVLEDRLRIPVRRQTVVKAKKEEVENPWVFGIDREDRDGVFVGYNQRVKLGQRGLLTLQPQVLVERLIDGTTDSYPYPWQSAGSDAVEQPARTGDYFGFLARLEKTDLLGFQTSARLDISTFNPDNIANGTRSWAELNRNLQLGWLGDTNLRLFGAYRFRTWNGTLGEQDVYSAVGGFLEKQAALPNWGRISSNYLWRIGMGNYQGNDFNTTTIGNLWRTNAVGSLNASLPLWTGKAAAPTPVEGLANTPVPIVPGLALNGNVLGTLAYYGDGSNQNTISLSGGPVLTLGHFVKPFLDYTQITLIGSGTLKQGLSPFSFDRAVDLATVSVGLNQQIAGPLMFSGGVGYNVDPSSAQYGEVTGSYLELRWQRRSYEFAVFYSPYEGLGGLRVRLNDFNFRGTGVPFIPLNPVQQMLQRPF